MDQSIAQCLSDKIGELTEQFHRYVFEHPDLLDDIPDKAVLIFLDPNDPEFNRANLQLARSMPKPPGPLVYIEMRKRVRVVEQIEWTRRSSRCRWRLDGITALWLKADNDREGSDAPVMEFVDRGAGVKGRVTMTLDEILQDIYGLDAKLRELEQRYGLLSADLYALYQLGEVEQSPDLIRWVGYYELRRERQRAYSGVNPVTERIAAMNLPTADWPQLEQEIEAGRLSI